MLTETQLTETLGEINNAQAIHRDAYGKDGELLTHMAELITAYRTICTRAERAEAERDELRATLARITVYNLPVQCEHGVATCTMCKKSQPCKDYKTAYRIIGSAANHDKDCPYIAARSLLDRTERAA